MECTLNDLEALGRPASSSALGIRNAVEHLTTVTRKAVYDTHEYNIMKRRKKTSSFSWIAFSIKGL